MNQFQDPLHPHFGHYKPEEYATTQEAHGLEGFRLLFWSAVLVTLAYWNLSPYLPGHVPAPQDVATLTVGKGGVGR